MKKKCFFYPYLYENYSFRRDQCRKILIVCCPENCMASKIRQMICKKKNRNSLLITCLQVFKPWRGRQRSDGRQRGEFTEAVRHLRVCDHAHHQAVRGPGKNSYHCNIVYYLCQNCGAPCTYTCI